jgi:hypothetical protein
MNDEKMVILNGYIHLWVPKRNAERLLQIELWMESDLVLKQLENDLGIRKLRKSEAENVEKRPEYIV